jgi:hypothetical protein
MPDLEGELRFSNQLSPTQSARLKSRLAEYSNDDPERESSTDAYPGGFVINDDLTGLRYRGEKSLDEIADVLEAVLEEMREEFPDFEMAGRLITPAENVADLLEVFVARGEAVVRPVSTISCPHCGGDLTLITAKQADPATALS